MADYREVLYGSYRATHYGAVNPGDSASLSAASESYDLLFGKHLPSNRNVRLLDLGCGSGFLLEYLLRSGYSQAEGIDLSNDQVEYCKKRRLPVQRAEALEFLSDNRGWDLIISTDVIEHLRKNEVVAFLFAIRDALKPGGQVIIRTGNASSIYGPIARWCDFTHEVFFTERSLRQVLLACGFANVTVSDSVAQFGLRPKRLGRWLGLKVFRALLRAAFLLEVGVDSPHLFGKFLVSSGFKR
ncbi:MAG: class I SAM-dependent methyltransferase [Candidatus Binataceae bacterium]